MQSNIHVEVEPYYLAKESDALEKRFVFSYKVHIVNNESEPMRLLIRHWKITDGEGKIRKIRGMGVVGEQPLITQNNTFCYTSGVVLNTRIGYMEGHYIMRGDLIGEIHVQIPRFRLECPYTLN